MTSLDYFVVDVFTETPLAGNPLAVVLNTCGLANRKRSILLWVNVPVSILCNVSSNRTA